MHNLKTCHINARSIYASRCHNKLNELAVVASVYDFDILCVTESWLSSNVDNHFPTKNFLCRGWDVFWIIFGR